MSQSDRKKYQVKWHKFQQRYEILYADVMHKALQKQVKAAIDYADGSINQGVWVAAINNIPVEPMLKALEALYKQVGPLWAAHTGVRQGRMVKALLPMGFSERVLQLMKDYFGIDLFLDAVKITEYTKKIISRILSVAAQSGASFNDIVKDLTTDTELSSMRARRIARTETVTAANGAAIINAKESGLLMNKEWLSVHDKRTRHSHREVDGQTIPLDAAYDVNGTMMQQPGARTQPNGLEVPAAEVVNCRCTQRFIPVRGKDGRLVRV